MTGELSLFDHMVIEAWATALARGRAKLEIWRVAKMTGESRGKAQQRIRRLKLVGAIKAKPPAAKRPPPDPRRRLQHRCKVERMARLAQFEKTGRRPRRVSISR